MSGFSGEDQTGATVNLAGEIVSYRARFWKRGDWMRNFRELRLYKKHARECARHDFHTLPDEYFLPFKQWCDQKGITNVYEILKSVVTGYGYGYLEVTPAFYVLHYINATNAYGIAVLYALLGINPLKLIDVGFGGLVDRMAESLDVRLNRKIERIERGKKSVTLWVAKRKLEFDQLIVATPISDVSELFSLSKEEKSIRDQLRFHWYTVFAAEHEGLPRRSLYFLDRCVPEHDMHPTLLITDMQSRSVGAFYTPHFLVKKSPPTKEKVLSVLRADLKQMHARLTRVHETRQWRYFPHFQTRAPLALLDQIQGKNRTFYVGGMCIFELTESITTHSTGIIRRFFGTPPSDRERLVRLRNLWYYATRNV